MQSVARSPFLWNCVASIIGINLFYFSIRLILFLIKEKKNVLSLNYKLFVTSRSKKLC